MSKYDCLEHYLNNLDRSEIQLSFAEIEAILGFALPKSAYTYPMWWENGGHTQAYAWLNAGFRTQNVNLRGRNVVFSKDAAVKPRTTSSRPQVASPKTKVAITYIPADNTHQIMVQGYPFHFVQDLVPVCENGKIKEYYPELSFDNKDHLPLLANGRGPFCRFSIQAPAVPGVYLWVANGQIIYIGETLNLQQRFNIGYGNISPRNCYLHGQSTNCKMNKVVMNYFKKGQKISLYFYQTDRYKQVELELLNRINTKYNVKDN